MMDQQVPAPTAALMALMSGMREKNADGAPTIAAQALGQMMPQPVPSMGQATQQGGIGAGIMALQQQKAMEKVREMAQQASQPNQMPGADMRQGVTAAPGADMAQGYADGGIVGYNEGGLTTGFAPLYQKARALGIDLSPYDSPEVRAEKIERVQKMEEFQKSMGSAAIPGQAEDVQSLAANIGKPPVPQASYSNEGRNYPKPLAAMERFPNAAPSAPAATPRPPAQPQPGIGGLPSAGMFDAARAKFNQMSEGPVDPNKAGEYAQKLTEAERAYLVKMGVDPDMLQKRYDEDKALMQQQRDLVNKRIEREKGQDTFLGRVGEAMRGFSQMRGEGIGGGLVRSDAALGQRLSGMQGRLDSYDDQLLKINELEITKRRALDDARKLEAMGRFTEAQKALETAQKAANEKLKLQAGVDIKQGEQQTEIDKVRMQVAGQLQAAREGRANVAGKDRITALRNLATSLGGELNKVAGSLMTKDKATAADLRRQLADVRRELAEIGGVEALAGLPSVGATTAPAAGGQPRAKFVGYE
jgi:hypothetical protein